MPGILNRWFLAPFHFDWRERASPLNDKVHFRAIFRPQMKQLAIAKILQPLPQFDPHPLLKKCARIHLHNFGRNGQACRRVAHP